MFSKRYATGEIDPSARPSSRRRRRVRHLATPGERPGHRHPARLRLPDRGANPIPRSGPRTCRSGFGNRANTYSELRRPAAPYLQKVIRYYNHQFMRTAATTTSATTWARRSSRRGTRSARTTSTSTASPGPNGETAAPASRRTATSATSAGRSRPTPTRPRSSPLHARLWTAEGWQEPSIFLSHMNAQTYRSRRWTSLMGGKSLATSEEVKTITKGALLVMSTAARSPVSASPALRRRWTRTSTWTAAWASRICTARRTRSRSWAIRSGAGTMRTTRRCTSR